MGPMGDQLQFLLSISCMLSPALDAPQPFLLYSSKIHLTHSLCPPISLLFLISLLSISTPSERALRSCQSPPPPSKAIPDVAV